MIFVNFKTYEETTGTNALSLVSIIEEVSEETGIKIIPVVQATDIREAVSSSKLEIWTQHVDSEQLGAHTGAILPEAVVEDGAMGTFLNHSERKLDFEVLSKTIKRCKSVDLKTLIFAADTAELKKVLELGPNFVSYEPPELVGSKTTSVSEAKPKVIEEAVEISRVAGIPLIVGAGIKSESDIRVGLDKGAAGFAVASDIAKAKDPKEELLELAGGYK